MAAAVLLGASVGHARVSTLEGDRVEGAIVSISDEGLVTVRGDGGDEQTFPLVYLRSIVPVRSALRPPKNVDARLLLRTGSSIVADDLVLAEETFTGSSPSVGGVSFGLEQLAAVRLQAPEDGSRFERALKIALQLGERENDLLFLTGRGELQEVSGFVEKFDAQQLTIDREEKLQVIERKDVHGVILAAELTDPEEELRNCVVHLVDGSVLVSSIHSLADGRLKLGIANGREVDVSWDQVRVIRVHSPRLVFFSDMEPSAVEAQVLVAPQRTWRRDRNVVGGSLRIGKVPFQKGIGMPAGTRLKFPAGNAYELLIATIGIDVRTEGRGDCEFVIRADGKEVFRQRVLGTDGPRTVKLPVRDVEDVELEVEPGENLDLSDHANWGDAFLLRPEEE